LPRTDTDPPLAANHSLARKFYSGPPTQQGRTARTTRTTRNRAYHSIPERKALRRHRGPRSL